MHILITGATGLIGRSLTRRLLALSHRITVLTRSPQRATQQFGQDVSYWAALNGRHSLDGFDAVVNLAGEPIASKRWNKAQKERLCQSRWDITAQLTRLILASRTPPAVFISGSAVGFYGDQQQAVVTEETAPCDEFTHQLCKRWESLALMADNDRTRVCLLRTGIVLASSGGALAKMLPLFRLGLGGPIGDGQQYLSWIHPDDTVNAIYHLLIQDGLHGPFNVVSPHPVRNERFSSTLAAILNRPAALRIPASVMRLLMGESARLLLTGQQAVPQRLEAARFSFAYPELEGALRDVLHRSTARRY